MNALLSILSFILALSIGGPDGIDVRDWRVGFEATPIRATLFIDPTFIVYADETPGSAWTFGSTVCLNERLRGTDHEAYILHHEENHVRQFHALGWMVYPAMQFLPLEWYSRHPDWARPEENDAHMWQPPAWWPDQWHFLRLELRLG